MAKLLFTPFSMLAGVLAGIAGRRIFALLWERVDKDDPPSPDDPDETFRRLILAAVLEGAVFTGLRVATDRGARRAFFSLTGTWPGFTEEDDPEAAAARS